MRTLGLLPRTVALVLAILLAGPFDLAPIDFEAGAPSPPSATLIASARKLRVKAHSPRGHRPCGSVRPDQDDPKDVNSNLRPVHSSAQPSEAPRIQRSAVAPLPTRLSNFPILTEFSRFRRLRC